MPKLVTPFRVVAAAVGLVVVLLGVGLAFREDPAEKPFLNFAGGGFIFNYRVAEVFYGFTVHVTKPLQSGSIIEAEFENPKDGSRIVVSTRVNPRTTRYSLHTPSVRGVKAGKPYKVVVSLYDFRHQTLIERHEKTYASQISDDIVPERPLTIGPGYHIPPDQLGRKSG